HDLRAVHAVGDAPAEELIQTARHDDRVEGRIRDEPGHAIVDQELRALALLHDADSAQLELLGEVAREGVERLVVVVVGVDRAEVHARGSGVRKKNAWALPWSHASRTSGVRSSLR